MDPGGPQKHQFRYPCPSGRRRSRVCTAKTNAVPGRRENLLISCVFLGPLGPGEAAPGKHNILMGFLASPGHAIFHCVSGDEQRPLQEGPWGSGGAFPGFSIQHTDASPDHSDFIVRYRGQSSGCLPLPGSPRPQEAHEGINGASLGHATSWTPTRL